MKLFVDTTSKYLIFILFTDKIIDTAFIETSNNQAEIFLDDLDAFLKTNNLTLNEITEFYFASGPGSFTGIRVALSFAKALKVSGFTNIFTINSLHLLINEPDDKSLIDARGKKSYFYDNTTKQMGLFLNDDLADYDYLTYDNNYENIPNNVLRLVKEGLFTPDIKAIYIKEAF